MMRALAAALLLLTLSGCASSGREAPPARTQAEPEEAPSLVEVPSVNMGELSVANLPGWEKDDHAAALRTFRTSCQKVAGRDMWREVCAAAASAKNAKAFFEQNFTARALPGKNGPSVLFTGYYEPELRGSRTRKGAYRAPLYRMPEEAMTQKPYFSRSEIDSGILKGRGLELAWVDDPVDLFFLQVQGSGRIALDNGGVMRVGYAGNNGRSYVSLGKVMQERGLMEPGTISSPSIKAWLRANPERAAQVMQENPRYVFFRERESGGGEGPHGSLGVPLTPERSAAVDETLVPDGSPVYIVTRLPDTPQGKRAPYTRLMMAQDRGGGVKDGHIDIFFGHGKRAEELAGYMSARGAAYVLVPRNDRS
ncbi:MAG: MltA domain-containing protein [Alphaproteobacteria bacterium]|nr:MltA domain-containing protein [Alphaproteobacteria bacterium]